MTPENDRSFTLSALDLLGVFDGDFRPRFLRDVSLERVRGMRAEFERAREFHVRELSIPERGRAEEETRGRRARF